MAEEKHHREEEAPTIAWDKKNIFNDDPVVVSSKALLLVRNLGIDLGVFDLEVGVLDGKVAEFAKVLETLLT